MVSNVTRQLSLKGQRNHITKVKNVQRSGTEAKNNMNTLKVKRHPNSDTKTGNREQQQKTALERSVMIYCGAKIVLLAQPHPQFLKW